MAPPEPQTEKDDPIDPSHSNIRSRQFARNPPDLEDEYFLEEELRNRADASRPEASSEASQEPRAAEEDDGPPAGLWERVTRAFHKRFNLNWRP